MLIVMSRGSPPGLGFLFWLCPQSSIGTSEFPEFHGRFIRVCPGINRTQAAGARSPSQFLENPTTEFQLCIAGATTV